MDPLPFVILDVFAEKKYAGNQLAVVLEGDGLSTEAMQRLAREMNFSETCFLVSETDGAVDARIFTPMEEVPFAGHPTVGMAFTIRELLERPGDTVELNLKVGRISVVYEPERALYWMRQIDPTFGETETPETLAPVLGLDTEDFDPRFPIQTVSTGTPFLIVPLRTLDAVGRCRVSREAYDAYIASRSTKAIFVYAPEAEEPGHHLRARMFADHFGIPEDPATGSAGGCLAGYLVHHRALDTDDVSVQVEQGYEMGRPSLLYLRAKPEGVGIRVEVGGKAVLVARGELV